ncbi:MAG: hypothetical protein M3Q38_05950, partial [Chloroflexota bacterium]|nr:hypothetical protein [Chloroflexota bacterium]
SGKTTLARSIAATLNMLHVAPMRTPGHIVGRDGLLWWILSTHRRRRHTMAAQLTARPDLCQVRLRAPAQAERWLEALRLESGGIG